MSATVRVGAFVGGVRNGKKLTMAQGDHHQRRIDRAHHRHLSAVRALTQIRKMGPAVQINIAEKQINNAG